MDQIKTGLMKFLKNEQKTQKSDVLYTDVDRQLKGIS